MANAPKRSSKPKLSKADVEILARYTSIILRCKRCGQTWKPIQKSRGGTPHRVCLRCPTDGCVQSQSAGECNEKR